MATPGPSVKLKRFRHRFGISAPRLAIRTHIAWYWRALMVMASMAILVALGIWTYDQGRRAGGFLGSESVDEIQSLRNYVMELDSELTKLRSVAGTGESSLQIEREALRQLSSRVRELEQENVGLKEDLAFFEGLMPMSEVGEENSIRIDHLRVEPSGTENTFRYRMLLIHSGSKNNREFKGALQLLVKMRQADKDVMITFPSKNEPNPQRFNIQVKHFNRLEGEFSVPAGGVVTSVEVRLLRDGNVSAKQSVAL